MSPTDSATLDVRNLSVRYRTSEGWVDAVDDVSFTIERGEIVGLAGESGSGKSTVAMAITRILRSPAVITGGEVVLGGRDLLRVTDGELQRVRWREVAVVFQSAMNSLNPVMRVGAQIVDVILTHEDVSKKAARARAAELFAAVRIDASRLEAYPHQLSGGMRQRAAIAMALALDPFLVVMDEPTTGLDVIVQRDIMEQIRGLSEDRGFAVLFITHDLSLLFEFCNRVAVMYGGRLVEVAPSAALFDGPLHPYTEGLLASIPSLDTADQRPQGIPGSPPDMSAPPAGCRFNPRCPKVHARCLEVDPVLTPTGGRQVACHLYEEGP
jgi:peptide/nickel transport system ATP-binding protein